jgi:hypothetical protein
MMDSVEKAQQVIDEAIASVHKLGCGIVADGTIDGNGVLFDKLRVFPTSRKNNDIKEAKKEPQFFASRCCGLFPQW